jgi:peptide/nickel transport system permease protein
MGYITHRLVIIIPTLLGASLIMFGLTMLIPGDPALLRLGNFATTEQLQHMREEMGLTKPPLQRYLIYLWWTRAERRRRSGGRLERSAGF